MRGQAIELAYSRSAYSGGRGKNHKNIWISNQYLNDSNGRWMTSLLEQKNCQTTDEPSSGR